MKRFILATVAGAALLTGATAASAQAFYGDGYASTDGYIYNRGPFVERGVGLQVGPVGVGVYPTYPTYGYGYGYGYRDQTIRPERDVTVNPRETQYYPQSPGTPGGN